MLLRTVHRDTTVVHSNVIFVVHSRCSTPAARHNLPSKATLPSVLAAGAGGDASPLGGSYSRGAGGSTRSKRSSASIGAGVVGAAEAVAVITRQPQPTPPTQQLRWRNKMKRKKEYKSQ